MALRNVTVTLDEEAELWARLEAARRDTSVSRLLGELIERQMSRERSYERAMNAALARPPFLKGSGSYLSREAVHERTRLR